LLSFRKLGKIVDEWTADCVNEGSSRRNEIESDIFLPICCDFSEKSCCVGARNAMAFDLLPYLSGVVDQLAWQHRKLG
jgi:hypothetical protein